MEGYWMPTTSQLLYLSLDPSQRKNWHRLVLSPNCSQTFPFSNVGWGSCTQQHQALLCTWILQVLISFSPWLSHVGQCVLHDLDVSDGAVALWEVLCTLAATLAVMAYVLPFTIAHDVTQGWLDKLLLQILREDYLKTCLRIAKWEKRKVTKRCFINSSLKWYMGLWTC